jgi:GH24 family phage-related lysozyme (muramidase)
MFTWFLNLFSGTKKENNMKQENNNSLNQSPATKPRTYKDYNWNPVINFEVGGRAYYERALKRATWPGGQSGVTIGIGADLGYMSRAEFDQHFAKYFTHSERQALLGVMGLKGQAAKSSLSRVRNISLSWENAYSAFLEWTLPKFWKMTNQAWPGVDKLCETAQVALVSIVFNRGASLTGSTRREMANIRPLVARKDYNGIANEIISMKRLWVGKGLNGLLKRRDEEARMVRSCIGGK